MADIAKAREPSDSGGETVTPEAIAGTALIGLGLAAIDGRLMAWALTDPFFPLAGRRLG